MTLAEFRRAYPTATFTVSGGKPFTYRCYQNPQAKATLILLILSEDDTTFNPACREDLIALMPSPTVVTDLCGENLALVACLEQYADLVTEFILEQTP